MVELFDGLGGGVCLLGGDCGESDEDGRINSAGVIH